MVGVGELPHHRQITSDNALMRDPLVLDHVEAPAARRLGYRPRLSMIYTLLNRSSVSADGECHRLVDRPRARRPSLVAAAWLKGTYSEVYPDVAADADGIRTLFHQFLRPAGADHVSVQTPRSVHEGGELGYALAHAAGAHSTTPTSSSRRWRLTVRRDGPLAASVGSRPS